MWKGEGIEIIKKGDINYPKNTYSEKWMILKINGERIMDSLGESEKFDQFNHFQSCVCDYCGFEGCSPGGWLITRKHLGTLLFLPAFDWMESYEQYSSSDGEGDDECPPDKWFVDGILVIEGQALIKLIELVPGLSLELVPEISEWELENLLKWESLVREKPKGFIHPVFEEYMKEQEQNTPKEIDTKNNII